MPTVDIGITRSTTNRWIFGVCGGIAQKYDVNPLYVRLGLVLLALILPGGGTFPIVVLYILAGLFLPRDIDVEDTAVNDTPANNTATRDAATSSSDGEDTATSTSEIDDSATRDTDIA